ncbi:adoMet dependent proline di-methyltransferase domain-containing protein [Ditylenchus destructor]|nr:adoMet dependent proline di-methyltransferase domain-containing protein [Ditylenchus destructor]
MDSEEKIYEKAHEHWSTIASDVDGMLGGFAQLHAPDVHDSKEFIAAMRKKKILNHDGRVLDCGSGIGRVTKHLLLPLFQTVDMVDFAESFIENSRKYLGAEAFSRVGQQFVESLHTFTPKPNTYDCIWVQWVSGHLSDDHFVDFVRRCVLALKTGGCIVFKDNITPMAEKDWDEVDNSWTRPHNQMIALFEKAGCEVVLDRKQTNFPKGMYEVRMFALKPARENGDDDSNVAKEVSGSERKD